jgi:hypothetical protein
LIAERGISVWTGEQLKKIEVMADIKPRIGIVCLLLTQRTSGVEK